MIKLHVLASSKKVIKCLHASEKLPPTMFGLLKLGADVKGCKYSYVKNSYYNDDYIMITNIKAPTDNSEWYMLCIYIIPIPFYIALCSEG